MARERVGSLLFLVVVSFMLNFQNSNILLKEEGRKIMLDFFEKVFYDFFENNQANFGNPTMYSSFIYKYRREKEI
jgi:hypothetical protein